MTQDDAKQLAYSLDRKEHTAKCMVETNPQIAFKTDLTGATEQEEDFEEVDIPKIEQDAVASWNGS